MLKKDLTKEELLPQLIDYSKEARNNNLKSQNIHICSIDDFITSYFNIFYKLKTSESSKFLIYIQGYLTGVINNLIVIKDLLISGYELQLQIIMRAQFEQLNILLSVLLDDKFFNHFTSLNIKSNDFMPLSIKQKDCKRILKKYFLQKLTKSEFLEWDKNQAFLYEEFSKSVHGNLTQVMLLSMKEIENTKNTTFAIAGSDNILERTTKLLNNFNSYSIIIWLNLIEKLKEKGYLH